jgi:protein O-mannosyl-transferase
MSPSASRSALWICLLLAALTAATFYPVLQNGFVNWDDMEHVARNPDMNPPTLAALEHYWTKPYFGLWIPVTYTTWLATAAISRSNADSLNPTIFHALNLIVHAIATILVYLILRKLTAKDWPSAAGAAIFAVHPIQVEAIAWVSGLRDVLAGALSLAAIFTYLQSTHRHRSLRITIATLFFMLALLSKPTAAVTPLLLAIILGKRARTEIRWLTLWLLLAATDLAIAWFVQPSADVYRPPIPVRPVVALDALAFYFRKLVIPIHLLIDYGRSPDWIIRRPTHWGPAALVAIVIIIVTLNRRRLPRFTAAIAIAIVALLPTLGLVPFNFQYYSTVADRYAYLAMLGTALAVASLIATHPRSGIIIALFIPALAVLSNLQSRIWNSTATLCNHTLATNPGSVAALHILTFDSLSNGDWQTALAYNTRALQTKPDDPLLLFDRGNILRDSGQLSEAAATYARSLARRPNDPQLRNNYAVLLAQLGNNSEAERQFAQLLRQYPNDAQARTNWATYLASRGQRDEALAQFRRALTDDPRNIAAERGIELLSHKPETRNQKSESSPND